MPIFTFCLPWWTALCQNHLNRNDRNNASIEPHEDKPINYINKK